MNLRAFGAALLIVLSAFGAAAQDVGTTANSVYRDFTVPGNAASGAYNPPKSDIRSLWGTQSTINAGKVDAASLATVNVYSSLSTAQKAEAFTGSPTIDSTAAIQAAANSLRACANGGGILDFPAGATLLSSGYVVLKSCTTVRLNNATIKGTRNVPMFINSTRNLIPGTLITNFSTPTTGNQVDHDISIIGPGSIDCTAPTLDVTMPLQCGVASFLLAKNLSVERISVTGNQTWPATGIAGIGVDNLTSRNNRFVGMLVGLDVWKGSTRIRSIGDLIELAPNPGNAPNFDCINTNGMGMVASDAEITDDVQITNPTCRMHGNHIGFNFDTLDVHSGVSNLSITGGVIECDGTNNISVLGRGNVASPSIVGLKIQSCVDVGGQILMGPEPTTGYTNTGNISATSGSNQFTISGLANLNAVVGDYISVTASSAIGGVTLNGAFYRVTAVPSTTSATFQGPGTSSATTTGGGTVNSFLWGRNPSYAKLMGISFINSSSGVGYPLITIAGPGHYLAGNTADILSSYGALIQVDGVDYAYGNFAAVLVGNVGPAASGGLLTGYTSRGLIAYNSLVPPTIIDGSSGMTCAGTPTSSFASFGGIVTHC